jgi:hypothetical protein
MPFIAYVKKRLLLALFFDVLVERSRYRGEVVNSHFIIILVYLHYLTNGESHEYDIQ